MSDFVHLHNHSHYSLQDAAATIDSLVKAAVDNNMHALALTDHGVMFGASEFIKKTKKAGIKPIVGMEAYIVQQGTRFDRKEIIDNRGNKSRNYHHLVLLAKNLTGYKNLMKLATIAQTEGFYYKPRIDYEVLIERSEGLICTSACPIGPISDHLVNNDYQSAYKSAVRLKEIFNDDFYLEIQDHNIPIEGAILEGMPKIARDLGVKLIATNDIHYVHQDHAIAHNILINLGDKSGKVDYRRLRYKSDQLYFRSAEEMKNLFGKYKGAIENTLEIEEKVNLEFGPHKFYYPEFPIPPSAKNLDEYFARLTWEGLENRVAKITPEIKERLEYEIDVIQSMGYSGYFLITQDFINAAKKRGIPVGPGRGSAAGSLAAYALNITEVNPLDYDLLFERFLNPARNTMPDIDVDFADDQRGEVIEYVKEKYGENSVSQIVTYNRLSSKAVLRDVARVLQIPIPTVNSITKHIPSKFGRVFTIQQALAEVPELKWVRESKDEKIRSLIEYSKILEGMNRNLSKHAAGVVITPGEVSDYVPLARAGSAADLVTQFNMKELEDAGLLKMDFLGLRTLSIIRDSINLVKRTRGIEIDIEQIPLDDEETYKLFSHGQTTAVFQFESPPMREHLKSLQPRTIKDLSAMNALYRPGPMEFIGEFVDRRHGRHEIVYQHPKLEPILKETYGIIVYQEQVIQIANQIAGMSLAEADLLRRAMGKKDMKAMAEQKKKFIAGAVENDVAKKTAEDIFEVIDKFANYGFNKSHAVAYSIVAYQTAYLKTHYLPEFLAANLTNEFENTDKVTILLESCRKHKVKVLPPDINHPSVFFDVIDGQVIFGMSAIKNVGVGAAEEIAKQREKLNRDFKSIFDFCANVDTRTVNKRALEGLVLAGAFDKMHATRARTFYSIEKARDFGAKYKIAKEKQADSLFGDAGEEMEIPEPQMKEFEPWSTKVKLAKEREVLGFYLSDHPLRRYETEYYSFSTIQLGEPESFKFDDTEVRAIGVLTGVRLKMDKSSRQMAFFKLDDFTGSCECLMFASVYEKYGSFIEDEATVMLTGKLESSGDAVKMHVHELLPLKEAKEQLTKKILVYIEADKVSSDMIAKFKNMLIDNSGDIPVFLSVIEDSSKRDFFLDYKVKITNELIEKIEDLFGAECISYRSA